ncbi:hypothetical protein ACHWQZ_G002535 [Mnemiopsis leidyi]
MISLFVLGILISTIQLSIADYYATLGVKRDATTKEIRSAFKKLALSSHPDKNKNDPDAEAKFMAINEAYEVLKDEGTRRKYDLYGEEGLKEEKERQQQRERHSYQYYQEFDIYGDDAEIVTLSSGDFATSVDNRGDNVWFINFYSPRCSHCHELAPAWRALAKELEGVVRIGAVNCADSRDLCQHIRGYPSLYLYTPSGRHEYHGEREVETMMDHVMRSLPPSPVIMLFEPNFKKAVSEIDRPWLVSFCYKNDDCVSRSSLDRVSISLKNMVYVGTVTCDENPKLCDKLPAETSVLLLVQGATPSKSVATILKEAVKVDTMHTQEITFTVLKNLPEPERITEDQFDTLHDKAMAGDIDPQIVIFSKSGVPLEFIKLKGQLKDQKLHQLDCADYSKLCTDLSVTRYPTLFVLKDGGYERYHGRQDAADIAIFIREAMLSPLIELTPAHFPLITESTSVVDFFAPWCPPCMMLLPELRRAAREMTNVIFGSVDCAAHAQLCQQRSIRSYPTMVMYNSSKPHTTSGYKNKDDILSFISDVLNPPVITLDYSQWILKINNKKEDEVWFVDYYAPWCGHCIQLAPSWNLFAKSLSQWDKAFVAKVDCTTTQQACNMEGIRAYPTIRVYEAGARGRVQYKQYQGWGQIHDIKGWAMPYLPSDVETLVPKHFVDKVLKSRSPWLVEFYTPMCGPCQRFATEMERLAGLLKKKLGVGKVNCNTHYNLCYQAKLSGFPTLYFYPGGSGAAQDIVGVEIETSTADQIHSHLLRQFPFLNSVRDEL